MIIRLFAEKEGVELLYIISENQLFTKFYLKNDTDLDTEFHLLKHTKLYDIKVTKIERISK
jgi:hypothetical protein